MHHHVSCRFQIFTRYLELWSWAIHIFTHMLDGFVEIRLHYVTVFALRMFFYNWLIFVTSNSICCWYVSFIKYGTPKPLVSHVSPILRQKIWNIFAIRQSWIQCRSKESHPKRWTSEGTAGSIFPSPAVPVVSQEGFSESTSKVRGAQGGPS